MIPWHRLLGLALQDFLTDSCYQIEIEKDLSVQQQRLDLIIIEQGPGVRAPELPDGLENLSKYNLLTYKSWRQPLNEWTLDELIGHYVSYRKLVSPNVDQLLPISDFELYALSTRYPQGLASQITLQPLEKSGIYQLTWGSKQVRILVLNQMELIPKNALWLLFSSNVKQVQFGSQYYRSYSEVTSSVLNQLFEYYCLEGISMSYTKEDFIKEYTRDHLRLLSPDEVLNQFSPTERLQGLSPDQVLNQFSPTDRLQGLSVESVEAYLLELKKKQNN